MDKVDTISNQSKDKECPRVPIKTYKWEDVRRARIKGAYPWTHLNKGPYDEEIDPDIFKMDRFRKNKSSSTLGDVSIKSEESSGGVVIEEITESDNEKIKDENKENKASNVIEMAADSSGDDNISQYLDKDGSEQNIDQAGPSTQQTTEEITTADRQQRAKSEEPKRKRKLSIESSYSRISMKSLSKLGIVKRIREAKNKIKMPKFPSFTKLDKRQKTDKPSEEPTPVEPKKDIKPKSKPLKDEKPVYIHIPLKLPPGVTDEFSKYADEPVVSSSKTPTTTSTENKGSPEEEGKSEEAHEENKDQNVHLIILTAPSDDELLEEAPIPETPSSEKDRQIDKANMDAMKSLATKVVDDEFIQENKDLRAISEEPSSDEKEVEKSNGEELTTETVTAETETKIETVTAETETKIETAKTESEADKEEGTKSKKSKRKKKRDKATEEGESEAQKAEEEPLENITDDQKQLELEKSIPKPEDSEEKKQEIMMVDEEDGLKLSETAIALINEELAKENLPKLNESELKSSLKSQESPGSPTMKKKVSFKRKNKKENDYEIIEVPKGEKPAGTTAVPLETAQSMSVDEEKTYLDEKIIKSTSLEEDYNKWSKNLDHEYEPVNPPPEDIVITPTVPQSSPKQTTTTKDSKTKTSKSKSGKNKSSKDRSPSPSPRYIRIPLHEDVVISSDGDETDKNDGESAHQLQERLEAQYFNDTGPSTSINGTNATTSSQATASSSPKKDSKSTVLTQIEGQGKKIKDAFNTQTGKFKTKIKGMKRPNISMPSKPTFDKAKMQRIKDSMPKMPQASKFKMPKIPERTKINFSSLSLPKKKQSTATTTTKLKQQRYSTESNAGGDSKMKIFDFSTYPRIFKGRGSSSKKDDTLDDFPEAATVPRTKDSKKSAKDAPKHDSPVYIRIPLHSEESMERLEPLDTNREVASHTRYKEDIDIDDAYQKENQEIHKASPFSSKYVERWKHGTFHALMKKQPQEEPPPPLQQNEQMQEEENVRITDLDNSDEQTQSHSSPEPRMLGTGSLGDIHGRGVIEEINEDEFFVRQKGISQDNIEVGEYLTSEIREAFKNPVNPLRHMQDDSYDKEYEIDISDQSIEETPKKKPIRKPKRKRTPHVSQEKIPYDEESITTEPEEYPKAYPPGRPKRRSKKGPKKAADVIPYQETIPVDKPPETLHSQERIDIQMYENELMKDIEQPEIVISNSYQQREFYDKDIDEFIDDEMPHAPPRKQRSLKSLTASEHDSIIGEFNRGDRDFTSQEIEAFRMEHEYIIPTPELEPPIRPRRSRTRSQSYITPSGDESQEQREVIEEIQRYEDEQQLQQPCLEPPCVRDLRDSMGYAVIDKNRHHEPPLPPPRIIDQPKTPPRRRRGKIKDDETKFFTVPRQLNDAAPPTRPLRNYSTLNSNLSKVKISLQNLTDEEKENVDICPYTEIPDDEQMRNLQSGEVVQKMKDRPLPAPPRPPRKTRGSRTLRDITNDDMENIIENIEKDIIQEAEMSTQTEPLPEDFECEEIVEDKRDRVIAPSRSFENEETITHGSLVVQPLDNAQILPEHQISRERIIPITRTDAHFYENEISEVPEDFLNLKSPETYETDVKSSGDEFKQTKVEYVQQQPITNTEVETLKAQKLQVSDLDVDRLTVNELLASKIRVSEIDSGNIQVSEINSQGGNLIVSGIELPPSFFQQLVDKLQSSATKPTTQSDEKAEQKKTPIDQELKESEQQEQQPERPPRSSKTDDVRDEESPTKCDDVEQIEEIRQWEERDFEEEQKELEEQQQFEKDQQIIEEILQMDMDRQQIESEIRQIIEENQEMQTNVPERPPRSKHEQNIDRIEPSSSDRQEIKENIPIETKSASEIEAEARREIEMHSILQSSDHDIPPPRPPQPFSLHGEDFIYLPSQPPPSFYELRTPIYAEFLDDDNPLPPRRRRHQKQQIKDSSSEETIPVQRRQRRSRTPEATIPELAGQLGRACASEGNRQFKRLISYITNYVLDNADGKRDLHVTIVILLVLIAGLILLGFGDGTTIHHHHWEYFNPPKNL